MRYLGSYCKFLVAMVLKYARINLSVAYHDLPLRDLLCFTKSSTNLDPTSILPSLSLFYGHSSLIYCATSIERDSLITTTFI